MTRRPRILITRTRHQASTLAEQLEAAGAETVLVPTIELAPPTSYDALDFGLANLEDGFDWLVFTSANAVSLFAERKREMGIAAQPKRIAVIGPATMKAVVAAGLAPWIEPVLMPPKYIAESLAESLLAEAKTSGRSYLLVRAEEARDVIPVALESAGHKVFIAPAYRNITPPGTIATLQELFGTPEKRPDVITFTSSSTAQSFFVLMANGGIALPPTVLLASIGPITSETLRGLGYAPDCEAAEPTIESLAECVWGACDDGTNPDSLRE